MKVFLRGAVIFFALGMGIWIYKDLGHDLPRGIDWDQIAFILCGASLVLYALSLVGVFVYKQIVDFEKKGRCTRCGKRVKKGELYCDFHKGEVQAEYLSRRRGEE